MKTKFYLIVPILALLVLSSNGSDTKDTSSSNDLNHTANKKISLNNSTHKIEHKFIFRNLENQSTPLIVKSDVYNFQNIKQPIVMVSLFSTWCPPCVGQIPHLSNLQKKFKENLFIISSLVHDNHSDKELKKFIVSQKIKFFISNNQKENLKFAELITPKLGLEKEDFPLPLMILFVNGKYFTHYEGIMPEEMIESDIKQLLKKIKGKK